jgi:hypothetical protein
VVQACEPLGDGGFVVSGSFTVVGSPIHVGLAKFRPDGTWDSLWKPTTNGGTALAVDGNTLYVGRVAATSASGVALLLQVDLTTGAHERWEASFDGGDSRSGSIAIRKLEVIGDKLYVAGNFGSVNGQPRPGLAAFTKDGQLDPFTPQTGQLDVYDLVASDGAILVAGNFTLNAGEPMERRGLVGLNASTGAMTSWAPKINAGGQVNALLVDGEHIFVAGNFQAINEQQRSVVALVDKTGNVSDWSPKQQDIRGSGSSIALIGDKLYVGGAFGAHDVSSGTMVGVNATALDKHSAEIVAWNSFPNDTVLTIRAAGNKVVLGGAFHGIAGEQRAGAAALDLASGTLLDWNPLEASRQATAVYDMARHGGAVLLAGYYLGDGTDSDPYELVHVHPENGAILRKVQIPGFGTTVSSPPMMGTTAIHVVQDRVCLAGNTVVPLGAPSPGEIHCLDGDDQLLFSASADNYVWSFAEVNGDLLVGGAFSQIDGQSVSRLVRLDSKGKIVEWGPQVSVKEFDTGFGAVHFMLEREGVIYASGDMVLAGQEYSAISIRTDGSLGEWKVERPATGALAFAIAFAGDQLLAARNNVLDLYDLSSNRPVRSWNATGIQIPYVLHRFDDTLMVGGSAFGGPHLSWLER